MAKHRKDFALEIPEVAGEGFAPNAEGDPMIAIAFRSFTGRIIIGGTALTKPVSVETKRTKSHEDHATAQNIGYAILKALGSGTED